MKDEASKSIRILFVDDSKVMLKTASKILGVEFDVVTAIDGDDAWEKLGKDHDIQVLFTDINMPGTDGYGLLGKVRTADDPGLNKMPVILVTGADDDDTARQTALDHGATDFLNKKYISTELLTRARAHAKYQRISKQLLAQTTLDPMTGLANEQGFLDRLDQDIAYARRHKHELALMRVEIDHLISLYEAYGNDVVEPIVVHVANLIRSRIRKEDTAAHIGLGGFAVSIPGAKLRGVEAIAIWLREQLESVTLEVEGQMLSISLSTAVIGDEPEVWTSAVDALARCKAALDRTRQQAAAQATFERDREQAEAQAARERARQQAEAQAAHDHAREQAEAQAAHDHARQRAEAQAAADGARHQAEAQAAGDRARQQAEELAARKAKKQAKKAKRTGQPALSTTDAPAERATTNATQGQAAQQPERRPDPSQPHDPRRLDHTIPWHRRVMAYLRIQGARLMRFLQTRNRK